MDADPIQLASTNDGRIETSVQPIKTLRYRGAHATLGLHVDGDGEECHVFQYRLRAFSKFVILIGSDRRLLASTPAEMAEPDRLDEVSLGAQRFLTTQFKPS